MSDEITRRAFLAAVPAVGFAGSRLFAASSVRPFRIDIPQSTIDRILRRVKEARLPDRLDASRLALRRELGLHEVAGRTTGSPSSTGARPRRISIAIRSSSRASAISTCTSTTSRAGTSSRADDPDARLAGIVFEFQEAIGPLTDPARFGGSADDAFDVVVPSIPGLRVLVEAEDADRPADDGAPVARADDDGARLLEVRRAGRRLGQRDHDAARARVSRLADRAST